MATNPMPSPRYAPSMAYRPRYAQAGPQSPEQSAHAAAEERKRQLMAQGMPEQQAHLAAMQVYEGMSGGNQADYRSNLAGQDATVAAMKKKQEMLAQGHSEEDAQRAATAAFEQAMSGGGRQQQSGPAISPGRGAGSQSATYSSVGGGGGGPRGNRAASSPQDLGGPDETGPPDPYSPQPPQSPPPQPSQPQGPYSGPDIHGYPNSQYNPQYRVGGPSNRTFKPDLTTEDPARMAIQQRTMGWDVGNMQDQDYADEITNRGVQEGRYRQPMDAAFSQLWQNPGYTDQESANITREGDLQRLGLTPEQAAQFQFTDEEQAGIRGNPQNQYGWFNAANLYGDQDMNEGRVRGSLGDTDYAVRSAWSPMSQTTRTAIGNAKLEPTQDYMDQQDAAQLAGRAGIRGAYGNPNLSMSSDYAGMQDKYLGQGASGIRGAYNDAALNASSDYMQNMQFGPEAQQEMEQAAATSIGNNTRALRDRVDMAAAASGYNSPMAMAAAHNQMQQQGDSDAADALLNARVAAKRLGLDTTQRREDTRLGAAQNRGQMALAGERALMGEGVSAANARENTRLGAERGRSALQMQGENQIMNAGLNAASDREGFRGSAARARMGADVQNEQYLGGRLMDAEQNLGQSRTNAYIGLGNMRNANNRYVTDAGVDIERNIDQANSGRNLGLAQNRQNTAMYGQNTGFNQGFQTNNALSGRYRGVADQRITGQDNYRNWATGQTNQNAQLKQSGMQGRTGLYGATMGATNQAAGTAAQFKTQNPSFGRTFGQGVASGLAKGVTGGWYGKG